MRLICILQLFDYVIGAYNIVLIVFVSSRHERNHFWFPFSCCFPSFDNCYDIEIEHFWQTICADYLHSNKHGTHKTKAIKILSKSITQIGGSANVIFLYVPVNCSVTLKLMLQTRHNYTSCQKPHSCTMLYCCQY